MVANTSARYTAKPKRKDISPERNRSNIPTWAHPEYKYYWDEWKIIRDTSEGDRDVKGERETYLPRLEGMELGEYKVYLDRASFYNFTGRTVGALVGTLLKKQPVVDALPPDLVAKLETITQDSESWAVFTERAAEEFVKVRRYGVLVDLPAVSATDPNPYITEYVAEDILDWEESVNPITGRKALSRVVLREWREVRTPAAAGSSAFKVQQFRVLELVGGIYKQTLYAVENADATLASPSVTTTPVLRGNNFDFIPFVIFGRAPCVKPGMIDIARLNLSHYASSAILEHARFYTGLPVYWAEVDGDGEADYVLAPNRVWEVQKGCRVGCLEFNGQGLKFLENALTQKEAQAASLGGRMIGVVAQSTAESDNQTNMKDRNEQAVLLQNARALEEALTFILRTWALFSLVPAADAAKIVVELNKDFLYSTIGSREFRAIQSMYQSGALPIEVLYSYMRKAEVVPDEMTLNEFKSLLRSANSFPNQPDFAARKAGYANAQSKTSAELKEGDQEIAAQEADTAEAAAKAAAKNAARPDNTPPAVPGGKPPPPRYGQ